MAGEEDVQASSIDSALSNLMNLGKSKYEARAKKHGIETPYADEIDLSADTSERENQGDSQNKEGQSKESKTPPLEAPLEALSKTDDVFSPPGMSPKSQEGFKQLKEHKKKLETDLAEVKRQLQERDGNLAALTEEKARLDEQLAEVKTKQAQGETYKNTFDFLSSEELEEKYITPVTQAVNSLVAKFAEYGISEKILAIALNQTNAAEREEFIEDNIQSKRVKDLFYQTVDRIQDINRERADAEKRPAENLDRMRRERELFKQRERTITLETLTEDSDLAFQEAILFNKSQGELALPYFLEDPKDKDHNERIVKPAVERAKQVVETLIQPFKANGVKVSREYLTFVARLAQAGSVATTELARSTSYMRELQAAHSKITELSSEIEKIKSKGNPTPKPTGAAGGEAGDPAEIKGKTSSERLGNFMQSFTNGRV